MSNIKITCDSTCDLTPELYEKYDIKPIALGIYLGEELFLDNVNVFPKDVIDYALKTGTLAKTCAVSPASYLEAWEPYLKQGMQVIHINISSDFSSCYQNACLAASETEGVFVIDSRNLSTGSGHLAIKASELAESGLLAEEIVRFLEEAKGRLDVSFCIQHLDFLRMGGRCSGAAAFGANLLKIRPEIKVVDGKMSVGRKYRGSIQKTVTDYIRGALEGRTDIDTDRIFFTNSGLPEETFNSSLELIKSLQPFKEVLITTAGCTITCHCGHECMGVLFFRKQESK